MQKKINNKKLVENQYKDDKGLLIRKALHSKYSSNKQGFGNWLFEILDLTSDCKILELGSGNGDFWFKNIHHLNASAHLTLSDFSKGMVDTMSSKFDMQNVEIKQIDVQSIPFEDNSFDIIIANAMLYHIPNLDQALSEISRVLKANGKFYASTFGENGLSEFIVDSLNQIGIDNSKEMNYTFTLQNGRGPLEKHFKTVNRLDYPDSLEITKVNDLVDYIYSMTIMNGLEHQQRKDIEAYFNDMISNEGLITIKKEYGSFIASK